MSGSSLCWCCLFFTWISLSSGIRLYPCGGDGYRDVEENTTITFHCDQYTGGVVWYYLPPANVTTSIATCSDTSCGSSPIWTVTYISAGNSSVTTRLPAATSRIQAGGQYLCAGQKCGLHIIVSAVVSQPTTNMTRQDSGYTLSVSAGITQVYSSRGLYSCIGKLGSSSQTTQPDLTPPASNLTNTANRTGKCDVTMPSPVTSGTYPCSVTVTPGNTQRSCGSITIGDMRILRDSFSSQQDGIPVVEAGTEPGELQFQVLTTDTPHTVSFLYLGPDSTGAGYSPTSGLLSAKCAQTSVAYKTRCVIKAFNVTQDWIGYYNVTIATGTQSVSFTFRLQMKESSNSRCPTCSCGQWFEVFGAGLGVGLAVLVVVDFVILLCLWRRQWKLPCAAERQSNNSLDNDRAAHVESSLETEMSACATSGTGPYEDLKQSDIGLRSEYSEISGPSPQSRETDGGYEIPLQRVVPPAATER